MAQTKDSKGDAGTLESLLQIFYISKLSDLKKHCNSATIHHSDLANFVLWCKTTEAPFKHISSHRNFVPNHLKDIDVSAIAKNGVGRFKPPAQKAANKLFALLNERRMISGHMFLASDQWHFFYFDNKDHSGRDNHWKGGPHIHLISHLMPNRSAEKVWEEFHTGNPYMKGSLDLHP